MPRRKNNNARGVEGQLLALLQKLVVSGAQAPKQNNNNKRRRRLRRKATASGGGVSGDGMITLSRRELLQSIKLEANKDTSTGMIDLIPTSFSFLKSLSASFDRLKWNKLRVYYKPAVGTVYGGLVSYGMDWDFATNPSNRESVASLTPSVTCAAWQDTESKALMLPTNRLQSRAWYLPNTDDAKPLDKGPGRLLWGATGKKESTVTVLGEIWVEYSVTMQGTNPK